MAKLMFVLFQVLIPILLLNMLIAMMGNTYAIVNEKSDKEFLKQVLYQIYHRVKSYNDIFMDSLLAFIIFPFFLHLIIISFAYAVGYGYHEH